MPFSTWGASWIRFGYQGSQLWIGPGPQPFLPMLLPIAITQNYSSWGLRPGSNLLLEALQQASQRNILLYPPPNRESSMLLTKLFVRTTICAHAHKLSFADICQQSDCRVPVMTQKGQHRLRAWSWRCWEGGTGTCAAVSLLFSPLVAFLLGSVRSMCGQHFILLAAIRNEDGWRLNATGHSSSERTCPVCFSAWPRPRRGVWHDWLCCSEAHGTLSLPPRLPQPTASLKLPQRVSLPASSGTRSLSAPRTHGEGAFPSPRQLPHVTLHVAADAEVLTRHRAQKPWVEPAMWQYRGDHLPN